MTDDNFLKRRTTVDTSSDFTCHLIYMDSMYGNERTEPLIGIMTDEDGANETVIALNRRQAKDMAKALREYVTNLEKKIEEIGFF